MEHYFQQTITNASYILSLLKRLQHSHRVINVAPSQNPNNISASMITHIDISRNSLFLDEITDTKQHALFKPGLLVYIDARLEGIKLSFVSQFKALQNTDSYTMYELSMPYELEYQQRRKHFRVHINRQQSLSLLLPLNEKEFVNGNLMDLSAGGFCTKLDYNVARPLSIEQFVSPVYLKIPQMEPLSMDLSVRSLRHFPTEGFSLVGAEFTQITPHQQQHLERLVATLDRAQRRNSAHYTN